jgi:Fic family protein
MKYKRYHAIYISLPVNMETAPTYPSDRAGKSVQQPNGYRAFLPVPLPPAPPLEISGTLLRLLSDADRDLAKLAALAELLPNPNLFVAMYVKQEAVLSSQIEGTQSTLQDVLAFDADQTPTGKPRDVEEVVNYVRAMKHGLARLREDFPLSLRLIREIHAELMRGVRGQERTPGEFRTSQNWIGGSSPANAIFVPPPAHEVMNCLGAFEHFLHHHREDTPVLIRCALAHAQFETIHPFLDGNGRVGRLLITFMLCEAQVLAQPLLYLSIYLKAHRLEYYDRLTAVRQRGDWEGWVKFFLRGVSETARLAAATGRDILAMREAHRAQFDFDSYALQLLEMLIQQPLINVAQAQKVLQCTHTRASKAIQLLQKAGLLEELTGQVRNRVFQYQPYLALFENQTLRSTT